MEELNGDFFDWDAANIEHIAEHNLEPEEVEEAFYNKHIFTPTYNTVHEKREGIIGKTDGDRIIFVVFTRRQNKIRVVTALDANKSQRKRYKNAP